MPREEYENLLESIKSLGDINEMGDEMGNEVDAKLDAEMDDDEMDAKLDALDDDEMIDGDDHFQELVDWIQDSATDEQIVVMYNRFNEDEVNPMQITMNKEYLEELAKADDNQAEEMYLAMQEISAQKTDGSRGADKKYADRVKFQNAPRPPRRRRISSVRKKVKEMDGDEPIGNDDKFDPDNPTQHRDKMYELEGLLNIEDLKHMKGWMQSIAEDLKAEVDDAQLVEYFLMAVVKEIVGSVDVNKAPPPRERY